MTRDTTTLQQTVDGQYEECLVAFLDILGFANKVLDSRDDTRALECIIKSLKIVNAIPTGGKKVSTASGRSRTINFRNRFFSDSLVLFLKLNPDDISQLFFVIRYLQDQLWAQGICLRGCVTTGPMYWTETDDNITVGQGLIDAYRCESTIAIYPRIVVSDCLCDYIGQHKPAGFPLACNGLLTAYVRTDADGVRHLDLLHPNVNRATDEVLQHYDNGMFSVEWNQDSLSRRPFILESINSMISDNINTKDRKTRQKYAWLQTYRTLHDG